VCRGHRRHGARGSPNHGDGGHGAIAAATILTNLIVTNHLCSRCVTIAIHAAVVRDCHPITVVQSASLAALFDVVSGGYRPNRHLTTQAMLANALLVELPTATPPTRHMKAHAAASVRDSTERAPSSAVCRPSSANLCNTHRIGC
jgi:hypothetical protein